MVTAAKSGKSKSEFQLSHLLGRSPRAQPEAMRRGCWRAVGGHRAQCDDQPYFQHCYELQGFVGLKDQEGGNSK